MANVLGHADEVREGVLPTPAAPTPIAMVHPDDVTRLLGRPGRTLAEFLAEHRGAFVRPGQLPHSA